MAIKCSKCHHENPDDTIYCGKCASPLKPSEEIAATETIRAAQEDLTRGTSFANRYEVIEELGKGGMGSVYRVEDTKLNQDIALKIIKSEIASDKKTIERFRNELKIARMIAHRNVCKMYDLGEDKGVRYITMEYIPGEDLKSMIRMVGQLNVGKALSIVKQVCEGLAEAHRMGIVHRDLKPSNLMIDKSGNAKIMDFGIARTLESKGLTDAGVMIGTPEYMSPEQVERKEADQRSDIYSLGVILYEMVTGRVPFEGETPLSVVHKQKYEVPQEPKQVNAQIPDDLNRVIMKCLEKDKERRFLNADEVRAELADIETKIDTTDRIVPKRKPITSKEITVTIGLKKSIIPALVVGSVVIIAVIAWQFFLKKKPISSQVRTPSIAVMPFDDLSPQKDQEYLCDGFSESLINALTNVKDLRVPARTSSFSFREKERNIQEIGEKLNVDTVLEGSVQKSENKLRITAQLINVADESLLWSEQYDRNMDDIFAIQDEISLSIVDKLRVNLLGEERAKLVKRHTKDMGAYDLYLKGRYLQNREDPERVIEAKECFEQAISRDPNFAAAYAGLAATFWMIDFQSDLGIGVAALKAREAAEKALELDDNSSEAHTAMGVIYEIFDWNWEKAEQEFRRAIELNPNYMEAHHEYSLLLSRVGRFEEAQFEMRLMQELDPLSYVARGGVIEVYLWSRQYDRIIDEFPIEDTCDHSAYVGLAYVQEKMYEEALMFLEPCLAHVGGVPTFIGTLAYVYGISGKSDKARELIEKLKGKVRQANVSYAIAWSYTGLGEIEQAFVWLERAYEEHSPMFINLKVDPRFDSVRSDPRLKALLKKVGLE
ncbi:MAG: FlgO family outer membrane protein [Candidatus Hodarchaeota archaeon]